MNLAYIITAYTDKKNLRRLINSLNSNADFYIHIDSKVDISPFIKELAGFDNVTFCPTRYFTNWGSFAQVLSQKELIRCVLESNINYDRIVSISGTDYPIWSNKMIVDEFEKNINKQYIIGLNVAKDKYQPLRKQVTLYHFFRDIKVKNILLKKAFSGTARTIMKMTPFRKKPKAPSNSGLIDVYKGADLWCLTYDCAKYVHEKMCSEKKLMKYFQSAFAPSEFVVHTIVFNSKYAENAMLNTGDYKNLEELTPIHYIDYRAAIKVFVEQDYDTLLNSGKMLFRKSTTGISDKLLDKIDLFRNN